MVICWSKSGYIYVQIVIGFMLNIVKIDVYIEYNCLICFFKLVSYFSEFYILDNIVYYIYLLYFILLLEINIYYICLF